MKEFMETTKKRNFKSDLISIGYQLLPLLFNLSVVISLFLILELSFSWFENSSIGFIYLTTVIGLVIASSRLLLTYFIPNNWKKYKERNFKTLHWVIAGLIYFGLIIATIFTLQAFFPYIKDILLWPFISVIFVASFDLFLVMFGGIIIIGELLNIQGEAAFVFVIGLFTLFALIIIPSVIFPNLFIAMAIGLNKRESKGSELIDNNSKINNKITKT